MNKSELIEAINGAKIDGVSVTEELKVEQLKRIYELISSDSALVEADAQITSLKKELQEKESEIEALAVEIEELQAQSAKENVAELKSTIDAKDAEIAKHVDDIAKLNNELQKVTDVNNAVGKLSSVEVEGTNYVINFPVSVFGTKFSIEQIQANEQIVLDNETIGIADHLIKVESPALTKIGA